MLNANSLISCAVLLLSCPADGLSISIAFPRPSTSARRILFTTRCRSQTCNTNTNTPAQRRNGHHVGVASTTSWALRSANNEEENNNENNGNLPALEEIETSAAAAAAEQTQPNKIQSTPITQTQSSATARATATATATTELPTPTQLMSMMGTSPRRVFLSAASSTAIALFANFFGVTSNLLEVLPEEFSEKTGLDTFYPRGECKRVVVRSTNTAGIPSNVGKCSFLIPKEWVADTSLALAQAQRQARVLDYSMQQNNNNNQQRSTSNVLPDAAYGPPGRLDSQGLSNGDTNVSVIINNGVRNFSLASSLGSDPTSAAETLLSSKFAPRKGLPTLVSAMEQVRGGKDDDDDTKVPVYQFEYTVDRGEKYKPLRAISVVAGSQAGDAFVTLTVVSTMEEWDNKPLVDERLRRVASSFKLV